MPEEIKWVVVTDKGFITDEPLSNSALSVENTADAHEIIANLGDVTRIDIGFPAFTDGRGFSLAQDLRRAGYQGHLRAVGHVIPDQFAHARRCGFDDVAISEDNAKRQPESQWLEQVERINTTYQNRLQQAAQIA